MALLKRITLSLAALALLPVVQASAADYDPAPVEPVEEYVPVEVGSGWYLRGDIAYSSNVDSINTDFGFTPPLSYSESEDPIFGSLGFGYHINNYLRAEVNFGYAPGFSQSVNYNDGTIFAAGSIDNHSWTGIINGYVDLGTYVGFTPYVGAGIGFLQSNYDVDARYVDATTALTIDDDQTNYNFAYTLNAGVAYEVASNLSIDLGYQFLSSPDAEYAAVQNFTTYPIESGIEYHQFKVGLRYDLW
jgi:opacity protein-like surface antigen